MRVKEDIHFTNYALSIMNYALSITILQQLKVLFLGRTNLYDLL